MQNGHQRSLERSVGDSNWRLQFLFGDSDWRLQRFFGDSDWRLQLFFGDSNLDPLETPIWTCWRLQFGSVGDSNLDPLETPIWIRWRLQFGSVGDSNLGPLETPIWARWRLRLETPNISLETPIGDSNFSLETPIGDSKFLLETPIWNSAVFFGDSNRRLQLDRYARCVGPVPVLVGGSEGSLQGVPMRTPFRSTGLILEFLWSVWGTQESSEEVPRCKAKRGPQDGFQSIKERREERGRTRAGPNGLLDDPSPTWKASVARSSCFKSPLPSRLGSLAGRCRDSRSSACPLIFAPS